MKPSQLLALFEPCLKPGAAIAICTPMPGAHDVQLKKAVVRIDNIRVEADTLEECAVLIAEQMAFVPVRKEAA